MIHFKLTIMKGVRFVLVLGLHVDVQLLSTVVCGDLPFSIELPLLFVQGYCVCWICLVWFVYFCSVKTITVSSFLSRVGCPEPLPLMSNFGMNLSMLIKQLVAVLIGIVLSGHQLENNRHYNSFDRENVLFHLFGSSMIPFIDVLYFFVYRFCAYKL